MGVLVAPMMLHPEDFQHMRFLSQGRYSSVARVVSKETGELYVVKRHQEAMAKGVGEDFCSRERRALETLPPHPNIIGYHGSYEDSGEVGFVLEHFDGHTLQNAVCGLKNREHDIGWREMKTYLVQIMEGVLHMHRNNVYHGDLKPENVLVDGEKAKLIDFGCSIVSSRGAVAGKDLPHLGTPGFMPPEAVDMAYGGTVLLKDLDIWAFGCIVYYVYTGVVPFVEGFPFDTMRNVRDVSVDLSVLPEHTRRMLGRIFTRNICSRYTTDELVEVVRELEHPCMGCPPPAIQ